MEIAIVGNNPNYRRMLKNKLANLTDENYNNIKFYSLQDIVKDTGWQNSTLLFVIIDSEESLKMVQYIFSMRLNLPPAIIASTHLEYALKCATLNVVHYLSFPIEEDQLSRALEKVCVNR